MKFKLDNVATPWLASYGEVKPNLDYSEKTISEAVLDMAAREGAFPALTFMGRHTSYSRLAKQYVQDRQPKSRQLKRFVALIRKGKKV